LDYSANVDGLEFFVKFSNELGAAKSVATRHNSAQNRDMPDELPVDLMHASAVLVHQGGHMPPLELLFDSPYCVLAHSRDWFPLQVSDRTNTISTNRFKPCLYPSALPAEPHGCGRPPKPPKAVTFHWLPVAPPPARLAEPPAPTTPSSPSGPLPALAAARAPSPPGLGPGTIFPPQRQGFFVRPGPYQAQRPSTQTRRPQRQRKSG
jgi:hypothetical protein